MKSIIILVTFLWFSVPNWRTDFEVAKNEAEQNNKFLIINFSGSDWCGPCMKLKKEVLDTEAFLNFSDKSLLLIRADFPRAKKNQLPAEQKKANEALAEKYNQKGKFPFTVLIDAKGKVLKEWDGYPKDMTEKKLETDILALVNAK